MTDGSGPFGGEDPIGPLSGFWLVPLLLVLATALGWIAYAYSANTVILVCSLAMAVLSIIACMLYGGGNN